MINEASKRWIHNALAPQFIVTWENDRQLVGTELYVALLKPSNEMAQTFGFDKEVPFFHSRFPKLQPRSMQAIEIICSEHPLAGRVDSAIAFLHSPDPELVGWVSQYQSEHPEGRIVVPLPTGVLDSAIQDKWSLTNGIKNSLFIRDLFDYRLPLKSDRFFYGREELVASILDNVRKSQNSGVFGLRKTGKTSLLLKIQRSMRRSKDLVPIFIDCKYRPIRRSGCDDLAAKIIEQIDAAFGGKHRHIVSTADDVFDVLESAVRSTPARTKLCIIFDEIEYISPISPTDPHWASDFIDLWQALWTIQTGTDKICYVVCGVNPTVCDVDRFDSPNVSGRTIQNPMFSIFNTYYLGGLSKENLRNMVKFFGSRMGMFFTDDAIEYIHTEYGGHPLLSRLACSFHHGLLITKNADRPVALDRNELERFSRTRDSELSSYCGHVVSEIEELYPDEYELLKMLASGEVADFYELAEKRESVRHIRDYGLVEFDGAAVPTFRIPVVAAYLRQAEREYIASDEASRFGGRESRDAWLKRRSRSIVDDLLMLNEGRADSSLPTLYQSASSLRGHKFIDVSLVESEADAVSFLVHAHKYLVEPADKFLRGGVGRNETFAREMPALKKAFMRLKAYRNKVCHIDLSSDSEKAYREFLVEDFSGMSPTQVTDGWFKLQRKILDHIHVALQVEIARI